MHEFCYTFKNSQRHDEIKMAKDEIASGMHPIMAMSNIFQKPVEDAGFDVTPSHFKRFKSNIDTIAHKCVFPDPTTLMGLCLYFEVHPADLIPEELQDAPSPRSIVQACRVIAENEYFGGDDREKAGSFLAAESAVSMAVADKDDLLWELIVRLDMHNEQRPMDGVEMQWGSYKKSPKTTLLNLFGDKAHPIASDVPSYPSMPTVDAYMPAMSHDKNSIRESLRQANVKQSRLSHHKTNMHDMANTIFGPTNIQGAILKTIDFLKGPQSPQGIPNHILGVYIGQHISSSTKSARALGFKSEEDMCAKWFNTCEKYINASDRFEQADQFAKAMAAMYRDIYTPNIAHAFMVEWAIDACANLKIINSENQSIPYMDRILDAYGIGQGAPATTQSTPTSPR